MIKHTLKGKSFFFADNFETKEVGEAARKVLLKKAKEDHGELSEKHQKEINERIERVKARINDETFGMVLIISAKDDEEFVVKNKVSSVKSMKEL